jgi:lipoprotein-anchoring transpeptidase ErfK/SrfK
MWWGLVTPLAAGGVLILVTALVLFVGVPLFYGGRIAPQVMAGGVAIGGLTPAQAVQTLNAEWNSISLRDGDRQWNINPALLGVSIDAQATVDRAFARSHALLAMAGWLTPLRIEPVIAVDGSQAQAALQELAPQFEMAPVNAGVRLVGGRVEAAPPRNGRSLSISQTVVRMREPGALTDGMLALVMQDVAPDVTDASAMVAEAERLLSSTLDVRVYDPVTGDSVHWSVPPEQWSAWLTTRADSSRPAGLALALDPAPVRAYLDAQAAGVFDPVRYLDDDEVIDSLNANLAQDNPSGLARVYHHDRQHVVQSGETLISIAWDYGVPYPWIEQANPGLGALSVGQSITIPSPDNFLDFPVVPDKRIVLSISQQHAWIYEGGQLKWDWVISTGIDSSPTWPGIYQIISHEPNAYAANWNLYMPHFLGVYRPIPGADFTNGFHGFPTRGGSQLLWTNSLGTRVTYGCILLSNTNADLLYNWAEEGVVVEIRA